MKNKILPFYLGWVLAMSGCGSMSNLDVGSLPEAPPEFHQRVGLFVHEKADQFYSHGTGELDTADLVADHMAFHVEKVLPFNLKSSLEEVFSEVRMKEVGQNVIFKGSPLAGYFEVKIDRVRYDYPDPDRPRYRAEVQMSVQFKTVRYELIWNDVIWGEGAGFEDANFHLNQFQRASSAALDNAFQDAVGKIQKTVLKAPALIAYFRWYRSKQLEAMQGQISPAVATPPSGAVSPAPPPQPEKLDSAPEPRHEEPHSVL